MLKSNKATTKKPLISVVLPTWNREHFLADAIRSVLGQSYDKWELIVVDDGSTDNTKDLMRWFCNHDKRIKYIHRKENKGISFTRNQGNKAAKGEIIVVMDSDDLMLGWRLEETAAAFSSKDKPDVLYTSYYKADSNGQPQYQIDVQPFSPELLTGKQEIPHLSSAYLRKVILKTPYQNSKRINDDWFLFVDLFNAGYKFCPSSRPTMMERSLGSGVSRSSREIYDKDFKEYKIDLELRKENIKKRHGKYT